LPPHPQYVRRFAIEPFGRLYARHLRREYCGEPAGQDSESPLCTIDSLATIDAMKRKKISASLLKVARDIHDSEEFTAHVGNIADRYRRELALETGPRGRDVRRALKDFRKHASALAAWLGSAQSKSSSLEYEALSKLGAAMRSAPNQTLASSANIVAWLTQAEQAAASAESQLSTRKSPQAAPRIAAEALRATFEHHGVKWSTQLTKQNTGSAVKVLCAIAKSAGDEIAPEQARAALLAVTRPTA
jgi:hypothetical protein